MRREEAYRAVNGLGGFQLVERAQTRCPVSAMEGAIRAVSEAGSHLIRMIRVLPQDAPEGERPNALYALALPR